MFGLGLLASRGVAARDAGVARDDLQGLTAALTAALDTAQVLVTTGGVSMGDRDLLRQVGGMVDMVVMVVDIVDMMGDMDCFPRCWWRSLAPRSTLPGWR